MHQIPNKIIVILVKNEKFAHFITTLTPTYVFESRLERQNNQDTQSEKCDLFPAKG